MTTDEEEAIVDWALNMAKKGFPLVKEDFLEVVGASVKKIGKSHLFPNGQPGRSWFEGFRIRHPILVFRKPPGLSKGRAKLTEEQLRLWYDETQQYFENNGFAEVLKDGSRIFNLDETGFFLSPQGPKVLTSRGRDRFIRILAMENDNVLQF